MGYYHSTYAMFGAEVKTGNPSRTIERILETEAGRQILNKHNVGYSHCGPYDNDFLFLCRNHQEVSLGEYTRLIFSGDEAYDIQQIRNAAEELGLTLEDDPAWLVVPDLS